jgi:hypothetical protein
MKSLLDMLYEQEEPVAPHLKQKPKRKIFPLAFPRDQHMGYVCELAVLYAIKGAPLDVTIKLNPVGETELQTNTQKILAFFDGAFPHKNSALQLVLTRLYGSTTSNEFVQNTYTFFANATEAAKNALNNTFGSRSVRDIVGKDVLDLPPSATAKYDVVTSTANIHVKLNQSSTGSRVVASGVESAKKETTNVRPKLAAPPRKVAAKAAVKPVEKVPLTESVASDIIQQGPMKVTSYGEKFEDWQRRSLGDSNHAGGKLLYSYLADKLARSGVGTTVSPEDLDNLVQTLFEEWVSPTTGRLKGRDKASDYKKANKPFVYELETPEKKIHFEIQNPQAWFTAFKAKYKQLWVIGFKQAIKPGGFLHNVQKELVYDIATKVSGEESTATEEAKDILWFYFERSNEGELSPNLQVKRFQFKQTEKAPINLFVGYQYLSTKAIEEPVGGGRAAVPKTIVYMSQQEEPVESEMTNPKNQLFTIELRTDGNNHPPQFKVGKGLAAARPGDGSLIGEIISVAQPPSKVQP